MFASELAIKKFSDLACLIDHKSSISEGVHTQEEEMLQRGTKKNLKSWEHPRRLTPQTIGSDAIFRTELEDAR